MYVIKLGHSMMEYLFKRDVNSCWPITLNMNPAVPTDDAFNFKR